MRHRGDPASWYWDALPAPPARARLQGTLRCDVGVVGGGIAGVAAALALAERGRRVVLLEARRLGAGASGRNGGQLLPGFAIEQAALRTLVGAADARRLWDLSVVAMDEVQALCTRHGIDCDFRPGHVQAALKPRHLAALVAWRDELEGGLDYPHAQLLDGDALQAHVRSPRYIGGLLDRRAGHLDPLKYLRGIAAAAEAAGATLHEDSRVLAYRSGADGIRVRTADGELHCGQLLLAGNAALGRVAPRLARRIIAVATDVIATEPLAAGQASAVLPGDVAVSDTNWVLDYFRLTPDRRLLFGGGVRYSRGGEATADRRGLQHRLARVFPALRDVRIAQGWSGQLDLTLNRAPDFGRLERDVYHLQGFSGHGVALAGLGGRLVADAMAGTSESFDLFGRIQHREFPGGPWLRRPALVLAMLWYRLRDRI